MGRKAKGNKTPEQLARHREAQERYVRRKFLREYGRGNLVGVTKEGESIYSEGYYTEEEIAFAVPKKKRGQPVPVLRGETYDADGFLVETVMTKPELLLFVQKASDLLVYGGHLEDASSYTTNENTVTVKTKKGKQYAKIIPSHVRQRFKHELRDITLELLRMISASNPTESQLATITAKFRAIVERSTLAYQDAGDMQSYYEERKNMVAELAAAFESVMRT